MLTQDKWFWPLQSSLRVGLCTNFRGDTVSRVVPVASDDVLAIGIGGPVLVRPRTHERTLLGHEHVEALPMNLRKHADHDVLGHQTQQRTDQRAIRLARRDASADEGGLSSWLSAT